MRGAWAAWLLIVSAASGGVGPPVTLEFSREATAAYGRLGESPGASDRRTFARDFAGQRALVDNVAIAVETLAGANGDGDHPLLTNARSHVAALIDAGRTEDAETAEAYLRSTGRTVALAPPGGPSNAGGPTDVARSIRVSQAGPVPRLPRDGRRELWEFGVNAVPVSGPAFDRERAYVRFADRLDAFNLLDGQLAWSTRLADPPGVDGLIERLVTETAFGTPSVIDGRVYLVDAKGTGTELRILDARDGTTVETAVPGAVAPPTAAGGRLWVPASSGGELSVVSATRDGSLLNASATPVATVPPDPSERWRTRQGCGTAVVAGRVVFAFNEGCLCCVDPFVGRLVWAAAVPVRSPPPGRRAGPAAIVPRPAFPRPRVATWGAAGNSAIAIGPDWRSPVVVDVVNAEVIVREERAVVDVGAGGGETWLVDLSMGRAAVGGPAASLTAPPLPTTGRGGVLPVWCGGTLSITSGAASLPLLRGSTRPVPAFGELGSETWGLVGDRLAPAASPQVSDREGELTASPWPTFRNAAIQALGTSSCPLRLRRPEGRRLVPTPAFEPTPPAAIAVAARSASWPAFGPAVAEDQPAFLATETFEQVPVVRSAAAVPAGLSVEIETQRRTTVRLRAGGLAMPILRLPGRSGDRRLPTALHRAWHDGDFLVLRAGTELFGVRLSQSGDDWSAAVVWPRTGGYPLGPGRSSLVARDALDEVETAAGPLAWDAAGRLVGDAAVGESGWHVAQAGGAVRLTGGRPAVVVARRRDLLIGLDRGTGAELWRRNDAPPGPLTGVRGDLTWSVGGSGFVRFDARGRRTDVRPQRDSDAPADPVAADGPSVLEFVPSRRVLVRRTAAGRADAGLVDRRELVVGDGGVAYAWHRGRLSRVPADAEAAAWTAAPSVEHPVVAVRLVDGSDGAVVGLAEASDESAVADSQRGGPLVRPEFAGTIASIADDGQVRWTRRMPAMALNLRQPPDVPILVFDWLERPQREDGSRSSLLSTRLTVMDRRTGEVVADLSGDSPLPVRFRPDRPRRRFVFDVGRQRVVVPFADGAVPADAPRQPRAGG